MNNCLVATLTACLIVKTPKQVVHEWQDGVVPVFVMKPIKNSMSIDVSWSMPHHFKGEEKKLLESCISVTHKN